LNVSCRLRLQLAEWDVVLQAVLEKGSNLCKGIGFVNFAKAKKALKAVAAAKETPMIVGGQHLKVSIKSVTTSSSMGSRRRW
jgi:hypothetical protein